MDLTRRLPTTLVGVIGALAAGILASTAPAPEVGGLAWAILAGLALSLMLHGVGLRVLGGVIAVLAALGGVLSVLTVWWLVVCFVPVLASGLLMLVFGPSWARGRQKKETVKDMWKQLDEGDDPTG